MVHYHVTCPSHVFQEWPLRFQGRLLICDFPGKCSLWAQSVEWEWLILWWRLVHHKFILPKVKLLWLCSMYLFTVNIWIHRSKYANLWKKSNHNGEIHARLHKKSNNTCWFLHGTKNCQGHNEKLPSNIYLCSMHTSIFKLHIVAIHSCNVLPSSAEGAYNTVLNCWAFLPPL